MVRSERVVDRPTGPFNPGFWRPSRLGIGKRGAIPPRPFHLAAGADREGFGQRSLGRGMPAMCLACVRSAMICLSRMPSGGRSPLRTWTSIRAVAFGDRTLPGCESTNLWVWILLAAGC